MGELILHPTAIYKLACDLDAPFEDPPREPQDYQVCIQTARKLVSEVRDMGRKHPCHGALMRAVGGSVMLCAIWESALAEDTPEMREAIANLDRYLGSVK